MYNLTPKSVQRHVSQLNEDSRSKEFFPQPTRGHGDCAFHAIFGKWNGEQFVCDDVVNKRKEFADRIRNCNSDDILFDLVKEAIKALVMENKNTGGLIIKEAQTQYKQYELSDGARKQSAWNKFYLFINKYQNIIDFIQSFCIEYCARKSIALPSSNKCKFQTCLNESGNKLKDKIASIPELDNAFKQYNHDCKTEYNWEPIFTNFAVVNEYASLIEKLGNWLLPVELQCIGHVFNITIEYYIKNHNNHNQVPLKIETYNKGKSQTATVCFNGFAHYEKMANPEELRSTHFHSNLKAQPQRDDILITTHLNEYSQHDEKLANKIHEEELADKSKFFKSVDTSYASTDFKQDKNTHHAKQLLNPEFIQRPISQSVINDNLHNETYCLFPEVFETIAASYKDKIAILDENSSENGKKAFTYAELSNRVNQLANYLKIQVQQNYDKWKNDPILRGTEASSLKEDEIPIGVYLPASAEAVICILAIWKAGLVYVPLGTREDRFGRTTMVIKQCNPRLILSNATYMAKFEEYRNNPTVSEKVFPNFCDLYEIQKNKSFDYKYQHELLNHKSDDHKTRAAYIFYSSGSAGNPKGIIIEHKGLWYPMYSISHMKFNTDLGIRDLTITSEDIIPLIAELTFDASILEIMMTLGRGACLNIIPENIRTDAEKLFQYFKKHKITICTFTPALLAKMNPENFNGLKFIISTGEKLPAGVLAKWNAANHIIINGYGPSEVTIATSLGLCGSDNIHIGQPIEKLNLHILPIIENEELTSKDIELLSHQRLAQGEEGELFIASPGLARGYLNNPELTKQRFIELTLPGQTQSQKFYRTRDAGKYNDGKYYLTRRLDRQTKVYGQLVNPEDIDSIIEEDKKIVKKSYTDIETIKNIDTDQEHCIITAYILLESNCELRKLLDQKIAEVRLNDPNARVTIPLLPELRTFFIQCRKRLAKLPYYQIPSRWCIINDIALNANAKLETKKLKEKAETEASLLHFEEITRIEMNNQASVESSVEAKLANAWKNILQLQHNDALFEEDNFLWLGGTSLHYLELQQWLRDTFPGVMPPSFFTFYRNASFRQMAMWINLQQCKLTLIEPLPNNAFSPTESSIPIILVHALWGNAQIDYEAFNDLNAHGRPIYLISAPGLKQNNMICNNLDSLAGCYAKAIKDKFPTLSSFLIAGWSTGGALANAVTDILSDHGYNTAAIILDTALPKSQLGDKQCKAICNNFKNTARALKWISEEEILQDKRLRDAFKINVPLNLIHTLFKILEEKQIQKSPLDEYKKRQIANIHALMIGLHEYQPKSHAGLTCLLTTQETFNDFENKHKLGWSDVRPFVKNILPGEHHSIKNHENASEWFKILLETATELEAKLILRKVQHKLKNSYKRRFEARRYDLRLTVDEDNKQISIENYGKLFPKPAENRCVYVLNADEGLGRTSTLKDIAKQWAIGKFTQYEWVIFIQKKDFANFQDKDQIDIEECIIKQLKLTNTNSFLREKLDKSFHNIPKSSILLLIDEDTIDANNTSADQKFSDFIKDALIKSGYSMIVTQNAKMNDKIIRLLYKKQIPFKLLSLVTLSTEHVRREIVERFKLNQSASVVEFLRYVEKHPMIKLKLTNPKHLKIICTNFMNGERNENKLHIFNQTKKHIDNIRQQLVNSNENKAISNLETSIESIISPEFVEIPHYIKREILTQLEHIIEQDSTHTVKLCFITGITGSGKSELARSYGVYYKKNCISQLKRHCIFWLNGESEEKWIQSIQFFITNTRKQPNVQNQNIDSLINYLVDSLKEYPEFVMVIDNFENNTQELLSRLISELQVKICNKDSIRGTILITTQKDYKSFDLTHWLIKPNHFNLNNGLSLKEGMLLLGKHLGLTNQQLESNKKHLKRFLDELGLLPLSISTAAACIVDDIENKDSLEANLNDYLTDLQELDQDSIIELENAWLAIPKDGVLQKHKTNQLKALIISIDILRNDNTQSLQLLCLLSYFESRTISSIVVKEYIAKLFKPKLRSKKASYSKNILQGLMNRSFLTETVQDKNTSFHLHSQTMLVCRYISENSFKEDEKKILSKHLGMVLSFLLSELSDEKINDKKNENRIIETLLEYIDHASQLNNHLRRLTQINDAEYKLNVDKLITAEKILSNLIYFELGDEEEAIKRYNHILSINHNDIETLSNRANCYRYLERYELAFKDLDHLKTLMPNDLAIEYQYIRILAQAGRYNEAHKHLNKIQERDAGNEYVEGKLSAYSAVGYHRKVIEMISSYDQSLQVKHIETKIISLSALMEHEKAIELCQKAINENRASHYYYFRLGLEFKKAGRTIEAIKCLQSVIQKLKIGTALWFEIIKEIININNIHQDYHIQSPESWINFLDDRVMHLHSSAHYWLLYVNYYGIYIKCLLYHKNRVVNEEYYKLKNALNKLIECKENLKQYSIGNIFDSLRYIIANDLDNKEYKRAYEIAKLVYETGHCNTIIDYLAIATSGINNHVQALYYYFEYLKLSKENYLNSCDHAEFFETLKFFNKKENELNTIALKQLTPIEQIYFLISNIFIKQKRNKTVSSLLIERLIKLVSSHFTISLGENIYSKFEIIIGNCVNNGTYLEEWCNFLDDQTTNDKFSKFHGLLRLFYHAKLAKLQLENTNYRITHINYKNIKIALKNLIELNEHFNDYSIKNIITTLRSIITIDLDNKNYFKAYELAKLINEFDRSYVCIDLLAGATSGIQNHMQALYYYFEYLKIDKKHFIKSCDHNEFFETLAFYHIKEDELINLMSISLKPLEQIYFLVMTILLKQKNNLFPSSSMFEQLINLLRLQQVENLNKCFYKRLETVIDNCINNDSHMEKWSKFFNAQIGENQSSAFYCLLCLFYHTKLSEKLLQNNNYSLIDVNYQYIIVFLKSLIQFKSDVKDYSIEKITNLLNNIITMYLDIKNYQQAYELAALLYAIEHSEKTLGLLITVSSCIKKYDQCLNYYLIYLEANKKLFIDRCKSRDFIEILKFYNNQEEHLLNLITSEQSSGENVYCLNGVEQIYFLIAAILGKQKISYSVPSIFIDKLAQLFSEEILSQAKRVKLVRLLNKIIFNYVKSRNLYAALKFYKAINEKAPLLEIFPVIDLLNKFELDYFIEVKNNQCPNELLLTRDETKIRESILNDKVIEFLEILDKKIKEINEFDERGWTWLHWAASAGNVYIVEILLIAGAEFRQSPFDGRTPLDCCPGPSLFSDKNDNYAELKYKLSDPMLKDKKPKIWSSLPDLLKPPVTDEIKQIVQDNIKSTVSYHELLDLKFNHLRAKGEVIPAELNRVYLTYRQAFNLILIPDNQFKLNGWQINDFSIGRLIDDHLLCERYAKEQKTADKEHLSQVACELLKRLYLILAFKRFGNFDAIKKILAATKIEAAKYKLYYYFERYMFLCTVINSFNNLNALKKSEEINLKRLLEENKYRVGRFQEIIAMPERVEILKKSINKELAVLIAEKIAYEATIKNHISELLRIAELPDSEREVFAKIFSNTNFGNQTNRQEQEQGGCPAAKQPSALMPKQAFFNPRDMRATDAAPMPALAKFPGASEILQSIYQPAAIETQAVNIEERETVYSPVAELAISSPPKPVLRIIEIPPQQSTTTNPRFNPAVSAMQTHGLLKKPIGNNAGRESAKQTESKADNTNILDHVYPSFWKSSPNFARESLQKEGTIKLWLKDILSHEIKLGTAIGKGDCFFDSIAQCLIQREGNKLFNVKSLRLVCDEYAKNSKNMWVAIANQKDRQDNNQYLVRIQFTAKEIEEKEDQSLKLGPPIWGRPKVEGRIFCEKYSIILHVIEIQEEGIINRFIIDKNGEKEEINPNIDYNDVNILHIVNYHNHYVPLIRASALVKCEQSPFAQFGEHAVQEQSEKHSHETSNRP